MRTILLQIIARPKKASNRILDSDDDDDDEAEVRASSEARETVISSSDEDDDEEWVSEIKLSRIQGISYTVTILEQRANSKVRTDTTLMDRQTRCRTKFRWFFWFL